MNKYLSQDQIERRITDLILSDLDRIKKYILEESSKENPDSRIIEELEDIYEATHISLLYFMGVVSTHKEIFSIPINPINSNPDKLDNRSFLFSKVSTNNRHPLSNPKLQRTILVYLECNHKDEHQKALKFIENGRLDKFEEICRYYHKELKPLGYQLTPGKACSYWQSGKIAIEYVINSEGQKDGEYKSFNIIGRLAIHKFFKNGVFVKTLLKDVVKKDI